MDTVTLSKQNRLFWLGRYASRTYVTVRYMMKQLDTLIDEKPVAYEDFCRRMGIPCTYKDSEDFCRKYLFDSTDPCSVSSCVEAMLGNGMTLRETITSPTLAYLQMAQSAMGSNQHPVALLVLVPEHFRVPEVIGGVVFRGVEGIFRQLGPVDLIAADCVHHAFLARSEGRAISIIVAGVETVVHPVLPQQHRPRAQGQVRIAKVPAGNHLAVILIFIEIPGGKPVDGVISLAVVIGIIKIIQLQFAIVHQGHHIAHPCSLRGGIELVQNRLVGFIRWFCQGDPALPAGCQGTGNCTSKCRLSHATKHHDIVPPFYPKPWNHIQMSKPFSRFQGPAPDV